MQPQELSQATPTSYQPPPVYAQQAQQGLQAQQAQQGLHLQHAQQAQHAFESAASSAQGNGEPPVPGMEPPGVAPASSSGAEEGSTPKAARAVAKPSYSAAPVLRTAPADAAAASGQVGFASLW